MNTRFKHTVINPNYWDRHALGNSVDQDQTPLQAASDLGLHCLSLIQQTHQKVVQWTGSNFRMSMVNNLTVSQF